MNLISTTKRILISSLAALPTSLMYLGYEGSTIKYTGWIGTTLLVFVFALVGCIMIGIPVHLFMQRKNIRSRLAYGLIGFISPITVMLLWFIVANDWIKFSNLLNDIEHVIPFAIAGAAVALAWREMQER